MHGKLHGSLAGDSKTMRPASAPAGSRRASREITILDREPLHAPARKDWAEGWDGHPLVEGAPRYTIPSAGLAKTKQGKGFRETFMDKNIKTFEHIPGPGAYKHYKDFVYPKGTGNLRFGKRELPRSATACGSLRTAPTTEDGDEVVANRVILSRPASAPISRTKRVASATNFSQVPRSRLPSSFHTPGPGSYTQFSTFGMNSGASTKKYLATNKKDNFSAARIPQKFTRGTRE